MRVLFSIKPKGNEKSYNSKNLETATLRSLSVLTLLILSLLTLSVAEITARLYVFKVNRLLDFT